MDRTMIRRHLAQAERHVEEGETHLARQRELVRKLERDGHGSRAARRFLRSLEETHALHVADRDRARTELRSSAR
ncbi:MAG: hypothetical protein ACRES1_05625 [Steroidobacteraceae bacterium]